MAHCKKPHGIGQLAIATFYDVNDNALLVAFAHIPSEDGDQWSWFLTPFKSAFPAIVADRDFVIISDQDKVSF